MATPTSIFIPINSTAQSSTINTVSSSAEILPSTAGAHNVIFSINGNQDLCIAFGNSGMAAATATNFRIPAGVVATFDLSDQYDRIRLYNPSGSTATYWIMQLSRS